MGVGKGSTLEPGLKGQRGKVILEDKIAKKKKKIKKGRHFFKDQWGLSHSYCTESGTKGKKKSNRKQELEKKWKFEMYSEGFAYHAKNQWGQKINGIAT